MNKTESLKNRVYKFVEKKGEMTKKQIVDHFKLEGVHQCTVYKYLKCYEENKPLNSGLRRGRPIQFATKPNIRKLIQKFGQKDGRSQRRAAKELGISQSYVNKILKNKTDIRYYKKTTIPDMSPEQVTKAKKRCRYGKKRKLSLHFYTCFEIMHGFRWARHSNANNLKIFLSIV